MRLTILLFAASLALSGCGDNDATGNGNGGPDAGPNEVRVGNNFFNPGTRTVAVGTTVTWSWNSGSALHNVSFTGGPASPTQSSGTFQRTFNAAGTFAYTCTVHGASMSGSIVVQ